MDILKIIIDFLFPKRKNESDVSSLTFEEISLLPRSKNLQKNITSFFNYKDNKVKALIWEIKYHRNEKMLDLISKIMAEHIVEDLYEKIIFENNLCFVLTGIPITKNKLKERGFCQTDLLCQKIINILNKNQNLKDKIEYKKEAIIKIKETKNQSHTKSKEERTINLKNCFWSNKKLVENKIIILIDDVLTTGRTIEEAGKTLISSGAKEVIGYTIAH